MKKMILMAAGLAMMLSAAAQQPSGEKPQMPEPPQMKERPSVEQEAQEKTDQMAAELGLDDKQIKKVLKFFKSDIQYRRENFEFGGGPRPDGNFPAPPSGGRPGGQGGFPGGGPGAMGPGGFPGGGPGGMRPGNPPSGILGSSCGCAARHFSKFSSPMIFRSFLSCLALYFSSSS